MNDMTNKNVDITPESKVGAILNAYPELEDTLLEMSPAFSKLKNPVLRKTVAKVANLRQVAQIGNIPLGELINKLRKEAGFDEMHVTESEDTKGNEPEWLKESEIAKSWDARPVIENGEQPMARVLKELNELESGGIFELITPFSPAPLIDIARQRDIEVWIRKMDDTTVKTYFRKG
ncbi:MAG: DUF1858 domain-containing protein [candidate division Zixibacteria bacterium]|nr:DUF1858 domain-containing protein [candidate division Zixibacteria bacterium]